MKWLNVQLGGQKWRIDLVKGNHKALKEDGDECHGAVVYEECKIYIAREDGEQAREDTLLHELLHASLHVSRGRHALQELFVDEDASDKFEEKLIEGLVLVLHPLLKELGFRFPKTP